MYFPSPEILEKYANVLINFALGGGVGIKPKESVLLQVPECAKPLLLALHKAVVLAGGYPIVELIPNENVGGPNGNFHIALGMAYKDSFCGDMKSVTKEQWTEMGFNDSSIHTDVISTENRTVTATLEDGSEVVIYKDGMFTI